MVLPGDPPEIFYGWDECGNCHAELDNGRHVCMSNFTIPSIEPIIISVFRNNKLCHEITVQPGDEVEFSTLENVDYEVIDGVQ